MGQKIFEWFLRETLGIFSIYYYLDNLEHLIDYIYIDATEPAPIIKKMNSELNILKL